jgi:tetratricopeptide (TPR) repeat protein
MKPYAVVIAVCAVLFAIISFTGFQCSSAELTSAKLYIQRQDWTGAEKALITETQKNPSNAEAWYLLGQVRYQLADYSGMNDAFNKSLSISKEFEQDISRIRLAGWGQALNTAVAKFNHSINAPKDSASILRQEAIQLYKTAITINPDSTITYKNLAVAQHAEGDYDGETASLKEALKRKPTTELYTSLVNAYLAKAQDAEAAGNKDVATATYNDALQALTDARKFDPNDTELLGTMIDLYVKLGRANEAMPFIREAVAKDPTNKVYQYNLGVLLMQTDSLAEAIPHFEAALQQDSSYEVALQNIAVAHMKLGDRLKKKAMAEGSSTKIKKDEYLDHFKKAAEYFERLVTFKPDDANYWDYLASAYANADMVEKAQEAIKKSDELKKK